jgi:hypothetical protein
MCKFSNIDFFYSKRITPHFSSKRLTRFRFPSQFLLENLLRRWPVYTQKRGATGGSTTFGNGNFSSYQWGSVKTTCWDYITSVGHQESGENIFVAQFQRPKQIIPLYSWNFQKPWQIVAIDDGLTGPNSKIQWPPWVPQSQTHFFVGDTPPFLSSHDLRPKMARFVFFLFKKYDLFPSF